MPRCARVSSVMKRLVAVVMHHQVAGRLVPRTRARQRGMRGSTALRGSAWRTGSHCCGAAGQGADVEVARTPSTPTVPAL